MRQSLSWQCVVKENKCEKSDNHLSSCRQHYLSITCRFYSCLFLLSITLSLWLLDLTKAVVRGLHCWVKRCWWWWWGGWYCCIVSYSLVVFHWMIVISKQETMTNDSHTFFRVILVCALFLVPSHILSLFCSLFLLNNRALNLTQSLLKWILSLTCIFSCDRLKEREATERQNNLIDY